MNPESDFSQPASGLQPPQGSRSSQKACGWLDGAEASGWLDGLEKETGHPALPGPLFAWQDEYCVGIGAIDEHHRHIFQLLNRLHEVMLLHEGCAALGPLLDELIVYVRWHFAAEELLMQAFAFPEALAHELEHERQLRVMLELREQIADGGEPLITPLLEYMGSWLIRHIVTTDRHYSAFFAERGARP